MPHCLHVDVAHCTVTIDSVDHECLGKKVVYGGSEAKGFNDGVQLFC